jgi:hypothetical protein
MLMTTNLGSLPRIHGASVPKVKPVVRLPPLRLKMPKMRKKWSKKSKPT